MAQKNGRPLMHAAQPGLQWHTTSVDQPRRTLARFMADPLAFQALRNMGALMSFNRCLFEENNTGWRGAAWRYCHRTFPVQWSLAGSTGKQRATRFESKHCSLR